MKKVIIIAEAGVNHNGKLSLAKELVDIAYESGADYVKFQSFKAEKLASKKSKKANYQSLNFKSENDSQFDMLKALELSERDHLALMKYCREKGIKYLSSPFDLDSIDFLFNNDIEVFKIPSGEITNYQYLKKISMLKKPVILSTGMSNLEEIKDAICLLKNGNLSNDDITLLHCNTEYPTPYEDANISAMIQIKKKFGIKIGLSDHTMGIEVPLAAVALGAEIIEKHFTISRSMNGPDHKASLEPSELKKMISYIRNIELSFGDGEKKPTKSEKKNISIARKSIHINQIVKKGSIINEKNLIALRPGDGISPMLIPEIIGKKFLRDLNEYHKLDYNDFE